MKKYRKLKEVDNDILKNRLKLAQKQSNLSFELSEDEDYILSSDGSRIVPVNTKESLLLYIEYLENEKQIILQKRARKFFNQEWLKMVIICILSTVLTLIVAWFTTRYIK